MSNTRCYSQIFHLLFPLRIVLHKNTENNYYYRVFMQIFLLLRIFIFIQPTTTAIINLQCIGFSFNGLFIFLAVKLKLMYCDRSAYYQKAIKAIARQPQFNPNLLWLFLLFGRLIFLSQIAYLTFVANEKKKKDYSSFNKACKTFYSYVCRIFNSSLHPLCL